MGGGYGRGVLDIPRGRRDRPESKLEVLEGVWVFETESALGMSDYKRYEYMHVG